jgi:hypothetical protein
MNAPERVRLNGDPGELQPRVSLPGALVLPVVAIAA